MERKDIIGELEEVIIGGRFLPNEFFKRIDNWLEKFLVKEETDAIRKTFYKNCFLAIRLMYAFFKIEENSESNYCSFDVNWGNREFYIRQDQCCNKIVITKDNIFLIYAENNSNNSNADDDNGHNKGIILNVTEQGIGFEWLKSWGYKNDYCNLEKINENYVNTSNNKTVLQIINELDCKPLIDIIYSLLFSKAFEIVCRSILSGEYAMDDSYSRRIRRMSSNLRRAASRRHTILEQKELSQRTSFHYFSNSAVALCQILDEYNQFCIQTDAQVYKDPASILDNTVEYYGYHQYEENLNNFLSDIVDKNGFDGFLLINPLLVHFFQAFLDMARIDQNYIFSKRHFKKLLYLRELLSECAVAKKEDLAKDGTDSIKGDEKAANTTKGKGIWQVWEKYQNDAGIDYVSLKKMLHLANIKNEFLIKKILDSCANEVKDLTYVGQSKMFVFDPRKCHDLEETNAELLLYNETKANESIEKEIDNILNIYTHFQYRIEEKNATQDIFDKYEQEYIRAIHSNKENEEAIGLCKYYNEILKSSTKGTSTDIRHYNTKVIEMARDAIMDTAEIRCWVKYHRHDFNEKNGFIQIKKVLLFLQERYEGDNVCYDNEMLIGYAGWCLEFLEIVAYKSPIPNSDRPSRIEDALLLLETLNRLLDKLIRSIEGKMYCLPYSSKFRGCFFIYDQEKEQLGRVFTGMPNCDDDIFGKKNFGDFVAASDEYKEKRKSIVFIASSYVPPLNYEKLKEESRGFVARTLKLRNEIHAEYFNRLREYIKEDSEKQLENNRRSVVQILGIFAAFLALTTVALSAANSESDLPFVTIMVGFTTCIVVFVALLYLLTHSKVQREYEVQRYQDKIFKQNVNKEILRFIHIVKNTISDVDNETERGVTKKVNAILDKETTNIKMQEDCLCKRSDFEERVEQIENKLDRIKHFKRGRYYLAKSWKIHPAEWIIIILLVVMTALTILLSINNEGKNNMSTVQIVTKLEAKSKDGKTKDNADITNNDKNHGNKNITEEGQNMEKEAESQKIISEQDPILDGGKKRVKEPVPEK